MKKYLVVAVICCTVPASAQFTISVATGLGTYAMNDMKRLQRYFMSNYQVDGEVNEAFPGYVYYEGTVGYNYSPRLFSEIFFAYGSTGGRVSYADYSGQVAMTQKLNFKAVLGSFGVKWRRGNLQFDADVRLGTIYSTLMLNQFERVGGGGWSHDGKYKSVGGVVEPNFKVTRIFHNIGVFAFAGYSTSVNSGFFESVDTVDYITTPHGTFIMGADWTGLRIGTGVTFFIGGEAE